MARTRSSFFFDNATNHTAFAADALRVSSVNISPGGNQNHNMRDGWNPHTQQLQQMYTYIREQKVAKGMWMVLQKHGLWRQGMRLCRWDALAYANLYCPSLIRSWSSMPNNNPNSHQKTKRFPNTKCLLGSECCAIALLSAQDFKSTRSRLQEIIEDAGHTPTLYPKFHCELNWIEYYWGRCKYLLESTAIILYPISASGPIISMFSG